MAQNHDYEEVSNRTQNFTDTVFVSGGKVGIGHPTMRNTLEIGDVDNATDYQLAIENTQFGVVINSDGLSSDASPALLVQQDGSTAFRVNNNGNVGIGTSDPESNLHIAVASGGVGAALRRGLKVVNGAGTTAQLQVGNLNDSYIGTSSQSGFNINTYDTARIAIRSDGNVGIGTGTANGANSYKLNVAGTTRTQGDALFDENLTVMGSLSVRGDLTYLDTEVTVTSAIEITNVGTGPAMVVNQTGAQPVIDVQDDGTSVFYVEDGGNVGIGITDPATKLHISGTDSLVIPVGTNAQRGSATQGGIRYNTEASTFEGYNGSAWGSLGGVMDSDSDTYITSEETSDDDHLRFYTAGTENMTIDDSGNVTVLGHLYLQDQQDIYFGDTNKPVLENFSSGGQAVQADGGMLHVGYRNTTYIGLYTGSSGTGTERIRINTAGNVGIGTTNPNAKLTVAGTISSRCGDDEPWLALVGGGGITQQDAIILRDRGTSSSNIIDVRFQATDSHYDIGVIRSRYADNASSSAPGGHLEFVTYDGASSNDNQLFLNSGGSVGIGTDEPYKTLSVVGSISATDEINVRAGDGIYWWSPGHVHGYRMRANTSDTDDYGIMIEQADGTDLMNIRPNGRVAIGHVNPLNKLHIDVSGGQNNEGILITRDDSTTADGNLLGGIGFDSTDGNEPASILHASAFIAAYAAEAHGTSDKGGDLVFGASKINDDDNTVSHEYMRITSEGWVGIGDDTPDAPFEVEHTKTSSQTHSHGSRLGFTDNGQDSSFYGLTIDYNISPDSGWTYSADKTKRGIFVDIDSTNQPTTSGSGGERLYGIDSSVNVTHDPEYLRGCMSNLWIQASAGAIYEATAGYNYLRSIGNNVTIGAYSSINQLLVASGTNTNTYSSFNRTILGSNSYGAASVGTAYGVYSEIEMNKVGATDSALTNAYVYSANLDCNNSLQPSGSTYLYYGSVPDAGGATNNYGLYLTGEDKNYISGKLGIGTSSPEETITLRGLDNLEHILLGDDGIIISSNHQLTCDGRNNNVQLILGGDRDLHGNSTTSAGSDSRFVWRATSTASPGGGIEYRDWYSESYDDLMWLNGKASNTSTLGDLNVKGDVIAFSTFSDRRLKTNIKNLDSRSSLDKICNLQGVQFEWIDRPEAGQSVGLIAQDVEGHVPEVVNEKHRIGHDEDEIYKRVEYDKLVALLVESVKEQQSQIEELQQKIAELS